MIMKTLPLTVVALGLTFAGSSAFAQQLRADVPFDFTTQSGGHLPAGKVQVIPQSSTNPMAIFAIRNVETKQSVLAYTSEGVRRKGANADPAKGMLVFTCAGSACALSGIFPAGSETGYAVPYRLPQAPPATQISMVRIPLTAD